MVCMMNTIHKTTMVVPVSQELLDDADAYERSMILGVLPMMSEARLEYWMHRGGLVPLMAHRLLLGFT